MGCHGPGGKRNMATVCTLWLRASCPWSLLPDLIFLCKIAVHHLPIGHCVAVWHKLASFFSSGLGGQCLQPEGCAVYMAVCKHHHSQGKAAVDQCGQRGRPRLQTCLIEPGDEPSVMCRSAPGLHRAVSLCGSARMCGWSARTLR